MASLKCAIICETSSIVAAAFTSRLHIFSQCCQLSAESEMQKRRLICFVSILFCLVCGEVSEMMIVNFEVMRTGDAN